MKLPYPPRSLASRVRRTKGPIVRRTFFHLDPGGGDTENLGKCINLSARDSFSQTLVAALIAVANGVLTFFAVKRMLIAAEKRRDVIFLRVTSVYDRDRLIAFRY